MLFQKSDATILQSRHCALSDIPAYEYLPALQRPAIVISAPHGGLCYPHDLYAIDEERLRRFRSLEDTATAQLAQSLHRDHRPVLSATLARAILDLNRPADALDPKLYDTPLKTSLSDMFYEPYICAGYGVIPRLSGEREALHSHPLSVAQSQSLLASHHAPYHKKLAALLSQTISCRLLIDIHSMPDRKTTKRLPDFVFGDNFGQTLPHHIRPIIDDYMRAHGYDYGWNHPYAGGYITRHYGAPSSPYATLQIEVNRRLYSGTNHMVSLPALTQISQVLDKLITVIEQAHSSTVAAQ